MEILVIMGTPRQGNTYKIVQALEQEVVTKTDAHFTYLWPRDYKTDHCLSCYQCFEKGEAKCPHHQVIQRVVEKMDQADAIIMASPVYSLHISADLKNLIDHLSYFFHRSRFAGKKGIAIGTTAGAGHKVVTKYLTNIMRFWGMDQTYQIPIQCQSLSYELTPKAFGKIKSISLKLSEDLLTKRVYPAKIRDIFMFKTWHYISLSNPDPQNADRLFWEKMNTEGHTFYPNGKIGKFNKWLVDWIFSLIKKIFFKGVKEHS